MKIVARWGWAVFLVQLAWLGGASAQTVEVIPPSVETRDDPSVAGRFGIGASGFITNTPALQGTFWLSEAFGVIVDLQIRYLDPDDDTIDSSTLFLLGGGVLFNLYERDRVRLEGIGSVALGLGDASGVALGLGLRPEYFVTNSFSIHLQVGILIGVDYNPGPGALDATLIDIGAGTLVGGAGFTFYF